jgi:RimJ/RimL family protein N-acetyltransferase
MKPFARGKSIFLREVEIDDAEFIVSLRTDAEKCMHLSTTSVDINEQKKFISNYLRSEVDYYFIICSWNKIPLGTVRIYDIRNDSFGWGSWILSKKAPTNAAIESALLIYDYAFFTLHYQKSHFDVRKGNTKVLDFHKRWGACIVNEDDLNFYFNYDFDAYMKARQKYRRYLP